MINLQIPCSSSMELIWAPLCVSWFSPLRSIIRLVYIISPNVRNPQAGIHGRKMILESRILHLESGIYKAMESGNPESTHWNPESRASESGVQRLKSGIQSLGIRESGIQQLESESSVVLRSIYLRDLCFMIRQESLGWSRNNGFKLRRALINKRMKARLDFKPLFRHHSREFSCLAEGILIHSKCFNNPFSSELTFFHILWFVCCLGPILLQAIGQVLENCFTRSL